MKQLVIVSGTLVALILFSALGVAQEKKDTPATKDTPSAKETPKKGTLPANFGKLGLSEEQKAKIHAISAEYKSQIDSLSNQLKALRAKERKEQEAVLTASQLEQLRKLQTGEGADKKPDAKPADKKPDTKTGDKPGEKPSDK